jgi:hypothetical protein
MDGMKLIDASEVTTRKKTSKTDIKKAQKSPMKVITEDSKKSTEDDTSRSGVVSRSNIVKSDVVSGPDIVKSDVVKHGVVADIDPEASIGNRTIRAIKLKEEIYYGPKNANKNKFVRMYKKLDLRWITEVSINGMMVDGWFNKDKSQYIIKLLELDGFKRFKFYGCDEIYDYFVGLHGVTFDHNKENSLSSNYLNNKVNSEANNKVSSEANNKVSSEANNKVSSEANNKDGNNVNNEGNVKESLIGATNQSGVISATEDNDEEYRFIGADLWSGYRIRQLLKNMPDNWGIIWSKKQNEK